MVKVGLTGARYSGKDAAAKAFAQIGVPVFDADTLLKYILNFDIEVNKKIMDGYGRYIFTGAGATIDPREIRSKSDFERLIEFAEPSLIKAYDRFREKNRESIYTIFHSSILFERGWNEAMDYSISVFSPDAERISRAMLAEKLTRPKIESLISSEMDPLQKSKLSDFVVHNYESAASVFGDSIMQVCKIDQQIVDKFLDKKQWLDVVY